MLSRPSERDEWSAKRPSLRSPATYAHLLGTSSLLGMASALRLLNVNDFLTNAAKRMTTFADQIRILKLFLMLMLMTHWLALLFWWVGNPSSTAPYVSADGWTAEYISSHVNRPPVPAP